MYYGDNPKTANPMMQRQATAPPPEDSSLPPTSAPNSHHYYEYPPSSSSGVQQQQPTPLPPQMPPPPQDVRVIYYGDEYTRQHQSLQQQSLQHRRAVAGDGWRWDRGAGNPPPRAEVQPTYGQRLTGAAEDAVAALTPQGQRLNAPARSSTGPQRAPRRTADTLSSGDGSMSTVADGGQAVLQPWHYGLCHCCADCSSCLEGHCCTVCQLSRQWSVVEYGVVGFDWIICCAVFWIDWCGACGLAMAIMNTVVRGRLRTRYGISGSGGDCHDLVLGCCCPGCVMQQQLLEMTLMAEFPGAQCYVASTVIPTEEVMR